MEKIDQKKQIALELNIKFNEVADLFSEESLNSMRMEEVTGGNDGNFYGICINFSNCSDCHCSCPKSAGCYETNNAPLCFSLTLPSLPPTPTLTTPTIKPL